jgi:hypothetical protein
VAANSAHDLTRGYDCARPGCEGEAEVEGGLCPHCTRTARERAQEGSEQAGKLETATLALIGLARELDAELAAWHADVEEAKRLIARER